MSEFKGKTEKNTQKHKLNFPPRWKSCISCVYPPYFGCPATRFAFPSFYFMTDRVEISEIALFPLSLCSRLSLLISHFITSPPFSLSPLLNSSSFPLLEQNLFSQNPSTTTSQDDAVSPLPPSSYLTRVWLWRSQTTMLPSLQQEKQTLLSGEMARA